MTEYIIGHVEDEQDNYVAVFELESSNVWVDHSIIEPLHPVRMSDST